MKFGTEYETASIQGLSKPNGQDDLVMRENRGVREWDVFSDINWDKGLDGIISVGLRGSFGC